MSARGRILGTLLVGTIALGAVETTVRVLGSRLGEPLPYGLSPPLEWLEPEYQRLVVEMEKLEADRTRTDLVVVGTSMVMFDIVVTDLEDGLPSVRAAGNLGAPDATAAIVRRWLIEEVVPRTNPTRVIWGVSSLDFNSARLRLDAYEATRPATPGAFGALDRALGRVLAVSRYRELLRRPGPVLDVFRSNEPRQSAERRPLDSIPIPDTSRSPELLGQLTDFLAEFSISGPEEAAISETKADLDELGIELVLLLMPVPTEYIAAHPGGSAQFEEWRRWVISEGRSHGVPVFDHSRSLPDSAFPDYTHLGSAGAARLTELIIEDVKQLGW